ncbi:hypothetical protein J6590_054523 [Homalodisca vitripennis]|nr:hypothetical protein J6590_054523 [Homalodisca vitripennis]
MKRACRGEKVNQVVQMPPPCRSSSAAVASTIVPSTGCSCLDLPNNKHCHRHRHGRQRQVDLGGCLSPGERVSSTADHISSIQPLA